MRVHRFPIVNRGANDVEIGLEPEGDCFVLHPGEGIEVRFQTEDDEDHGVEFEVRGQLVSLDCMFRKEIWKDGRRVR